MIKISIVILNWNGKENTVECLKSVSQLLATGFQLSVYVVDNGSSDESVDTFKKLKIEKFKLKIIANDRNLGYTGGNNVGIKQALKDGADLIVILNNDTIVDKNLINSLTKNLEENPRAGIISPKIYFAPGFEYHKNVYKKSDLGKVFWYAGGVIDWDNIFSSHRGIDEIDEGQYDKIQKTDYASGACMIIRSQVFKKIGYLDNHYFLYWEDADLSTRTRKAGFDILYSPDTHIWHKNSGSSHVGGPLHDYYLVRNRFIFASKYATLRTRFAIIRDSFRYLLFGRLWQRRAVLDYYFGNLGKGSFRS